MLVSNAKRMVERKVTSQGKKAAPEGPVGDALRSVYERAIEESIPQEMLDLLGKLK